MNRLPIEKRAQIIGMLVEGMSMRAASRLTDVSINTITKLLSDVGTACSEYQDKTLRNLTITQVQVDEIWAFIGAKQKNVPHDADPALGLGDCYTFTAIDPITKLMLSLERVGAAVHGRPCLAPCQSRAAHHRWHERLPGRRRKGVRRER